MRRFVIAAIAAAAAATVANADTVKLAFNGTGAGRNIRPNLAGHAFNCFAGQLNHTFSNGTGLASSLTGNKITFCTDLSEYVSAGGSTYTLAPISNLPVTSGWPAMGSVRSQAVYDLYAGAAGIQYAGGSANNDLAAAFQIALWEIVYDYNGTAGSLSLTAGNLKVGDTDGTSLNSAIATKVGQLFALLGTNSLNSGLVGLSNDGAQDQILEFTMIPLPAAFPAGLACLGVAAYLRRRSSRA